MREAVRLNPDLQGVLDIKDYNERQSGQRILDDDRLAALIEVLSRHRLGLKDVEPDILGRAYEYLLRKFAEGQGQSAGEFYTPEGGGLAHGRAARPSAGHHRSTTRPAARAGCSSRPGCSTQRAATREQKPGKAPRSCTARRSTPPPSPWPR